MNICVKCEHRFCAMGEGDLTMASVCRAPEVGFEPATNPVTGTPCYTGDADGDIFYADKPHPPCIWVNPHGTCVYFKAKQPKWFIKAMSVKGEGE